MASCCQHELLGGLLYQEGGHGDELNTGWAWCRECGAIFRRREVSNPTLGPAPSWGFGQPFGPIWSSDADETIWWTRPQGAAPDGWRCKHEGSYPIDGPGVGGLYKWCSRCGAVWQGLMGPRPRWASSTLEEHVIHGFYFDGVWHHPRVHGVNPDPPKPFDFGGTFLYGAPDA